MLRVRTINASSAAASAAYYAKYLTAAPGEEPGVWTGQQAVALGVCGQVEVEQLEALLSGRDPVSGTLLGRELVDRYTADGRVVHAVAGFDATFSSPKSVSVWWALTGDRGLLEAHDVAVNAVLQHLERFGSTTRIRSNGGRLHPDTGGLTMAAFRQTTSRADDPQLHTHVVISAKVQTSDGRWWALDARYLKQQQRMLGGLYQSVLRAELAHRYGIAWDPIVHGQAEIAGAPSELLDVFSKRAAVINAVMVRRVAEFEAAEGRAPSRYERMAIEREVAADTRSRKSGNGVADLTTRWEHEADAVGWSAARYRDTIDQAARETTIDRGRLHVEDVVAAVSSDRSAWSRADIVRAICDRQQPVSSFSGHDWARAIETAADRVVERLVDLDPTGSVEPQRRMSDGRSVWIAPTAARYTSTEVLTQEETIISWAMLAQTDDPSPSTALDATGLDDGQADAAAAVAGRDRLVLVVGPAGAGKTRTLAAAVEDLHGQGRVVIGVTPTAKAARVLAAETAMPVETVAKLLYDWHHHDTLSSPFAMPAGGTLIVDEAAMVSTPNLHDLINLVEQRHWRLALIGDPRQLQAVGRGGLMGELCANGTVHSLERLHRFTHQWEATASLRLRHGDPRALDTYESRGRIYAGTLDQHATAIAERWLTAHAAHESVAAVASSNDHVDLLNRTIQQARREDGQLDGPATVIAGSELAHVGDVVMTRRNDRRLATTRGEPVRNRETWIVTAIHDDGSLSLRRRHGDDTVRLPVEYVREHVRLGYAATEHGYQADTVHTAIALATTSTTRRGLYVAMTRGRDRNDVRVVTDNTDLLEARDVLEQVLAVDRADIPAVTVRRDLATQQPRSQLSARCEIPDWFPAYLDRSRRDLDDIRRQIGETERSRAVDRAALDAARDRLTIVAAETKPEREVVDRARQRLEHYTRQQHELTDRLQHTGRRERHSLRRDLADTDHLIDNATRRLQRLETDAAPARQAYVSAVGCYRIAEHRCNDLGSSVSLAPLERIAADNVDALITWKEWATGRHVDPARLADTHRTLVAARTPEASALAQTITHDPELAERLQPRRLGRVADHLVELGL